VNDGDLLSDAERISADSTDLASAVERGERRRSAKARRGRLNTTRKGKNGERRSVKFWQGLGFRSRRQPRSGSIEGLPHDVVVDLGSGSFELGVEVKWFGASKWRSLHRLRDGADVLVLYRDQEGVGETAPEGEVFLTESQLVRLLGAAYDQGRREAVASIRGA
jgi:hypothetical protein